MNMFFIDPKIARATWSVAVTLLLLAAVYAIRNTLLLVVVALLFAYLLYPIFDFIGRHISPKHRTPALALTYLLAIGILVAVVIVIGSQAATEARQLIAHPPDVQRFLEQLRGSHPALSPMIQSAEGSIRQQLGELLSAAPQLSLRVVAASANILDLIAIPILSFLILKDGRGIRDGFLAMIPAGPPRAEAERTLDGIHMLLLQYMRALFILCATVLVVFAIVLSAMGVRYALLLSTIAFFCEFIPLMGSLTAAGVILAVTALTGYPHFFWVAAFLGGFRLLQDYVISPRLMSKGVELHPMLVILGVFAGAQIGGIAGVFLSVPVLSLARLVLHRLGQQANR